MPLFLCGLVTGGFLASVVAASVAMLWLAPARHWFAGTTPEPVPSSASTAARPARTAASADRTPAAAARPPATQLPPPAWPAYAATQPPPGSRRPRRRRVAPPPWRPRVRDHVACCAARGADVLLLVGVLAADPRA